MSYCFNFSDKNVCWLFDNLSKYACKKVKNIKFNISNARLLDDESRFIIFKLNKETGIINTEYDHNNIIVDYNWFLEIKNIKKNLEKLVYYDITADIEDNLLFAFD